MPVFVLCLTAIFALIGAALSLSLDSRAAVQVQYVADESALSGATAFLSSNSLKLDDRIAEAEDQSRNAADANSDYRLRFFDVLSVSEDPFQQAIKMAVEVEFQPSNAAAGFTGRNANVDIRRRAVSEAVRGFPLCILALAESGEGVRVHTYSATQKLSAKNCLIWSNSKSNRSINVIAGGLEARGICTAGDHRTGGRSIPIPETRCNTIPDPLEGFTVDTPATCDYTNFVTEMGKSYTLKPGVYCGGLTVWRKKDVTFEPGVYVIRNGPLRLNSGKSMVIEDVTFLLDGVLSFLDLEGNGLKMRAPKTGETAGVAIAQIVPKGILVYPAYMKTRLDLQGLIYLPSYNLTVVRDGGGDTKSPYIQMIVNRIHLFGNVELNIDFDPNKTEMPVVIQPEMIARLIE